MRKSQQALALLAALALLLVVVGLLLYLNSPAGSFEATVTHVGWQRSIAVLERHEADGETWEWNCSGNTDECYFRLVAGSRQCESRKSGEHSEPDMSVPEVVVTQCSMVDDLTKPTQVVTGSHWECPQAKEWQCKVPKVWVEGADGNEELECPDGQEDLVCPVEDELVQEYRTEYGKKQQCRETERYQPTKMVDDYSNWCQVVNVTWPVSKAFTANQDTAQAPVWPTYDASAFLSETREQGSESYGCTYQYAQGDEIKTFDETYSQDDWQKMCDPEQSYIITLNRMGGVHDIKRADEAA